MGLQELRIAKNNPFIRLKRKNTQKALNEIYSINTDGDELPKLEGWLEKKQSSLPYSWNKRWCIVRASFMVWSDIQRSIADPRDPEQRSKFGSFVNLLQVLEIKPVRKGKSHRKFVIVLKANKNEKRKQIQWKCSSEYDRDFWVRGLKKHVKHTQKLVDYLGTREMSVSHKTHSPHHSRVY